MKKREVRHNLFVLEFDDQKEMAHTFLRFQEHYESPKFARKIFTPEEFKEWYKKEHNGRFTYHLDWTGFNIPSSVLKKFYQGKFNPLTENEKKLLKIFNRHRGDFYIIAHKKTLTGKSSLLQHELAHGLFYIDKDYRREVLKILKRHNLKEIKKELLSLGGYNEKVLNDEIQAYSVSLSHTLDAEIPYEMKAEIKKVFHHYHNKPQHS